MASALALWGHFYYYLGKQNEFPDPAASHAFCMLPPWAPLLASCKRQHTRVLDIVSANSAMQTAGCLKLRREQTYFEPQVTCTGNQPVLLEGYSFRWASSVENRAWFAPPKQLALRGDTTSCYLGLLIVEIHY